MLLLMRDSAVYELTFYRIVVHIMFTLIVLNTDYVIYELSIYHASLYS